MNIRIRQARPEDLPSIAALEAACFPAAEAADSAAFEQRIKTFPESYFVAEVEGQIVGMINGCVTNDETISDVLFEDSSRHNPGGRYQSIFGLDVLPDWQHKGIATILMTYLIHKAMDSGREFRPRLTAALSGMICFWPFNSPTGAVFLFFPNSSCFYHFQHRCTFCL